MNNYTIADVSYNQDDELEQFLIFWDEGEPDTRRATAENVLLFDPEDELPFDGGLHRFLNGKSALKISDDTIVSQSGDEYSYILSVEGQTVETTPKQAEDLLDGVYDALVDEDMESLHRLHRSIMSSQVRRSVVTALHQTFHESDRIDVVSNGWLIDDFYLVDWNAKMYAANDDREEGDYVRSGSTAVQKDTTYEFVRLNYSLGSEFESVTVTIDGDERTLTEREMVFLSKVTWLLDREHYHPDTPFWSYVDQWATMPEDEPNLDKFTL